MSYFLSEKPLAQGAVLTLEGNEAKHLMLSRRVKVGEAIELQDSNLNRFACKIIQVGKKGITVEAVTQIKAPLEYNTRITLYQAHIAEQALDLIIHKATELGAAELILFQSDHSPQAIKTGKLERWQRIAQEAAKQSGRSRPVQIQIQDFNTVLNQSSPDNTFFCSESSSQTIAGMGAKLAKMKSIRLFIGPEGGWSTQETGQFAAKGISPLRLGRFTLRAETATITALSQVTLFIS